MGMKGAIIIVGLIILISIIDLAINVVSFIPIIGDLLETMGEMGLEALQIILTFVLLGTVAKGD